MDTKTIALQGTLADYLQFVDRSMAAEAASASPPVSLLGRLAALPAGWDALDEFGVDTFSKQIVGPVAPHAEAHDRKGRFLARGVNFASQDYLSLSTHPSIRQAAMGAIERYGVHAGGSAALMGNCEASIELEARLSAWLNVAECSLFPTGWGAGYGAIRALVRQHDHVVIDKLAHASLQEGARAATSHVHAFSHLSLDDLERQLVSIRAQDARAGVLVVTESLFSMDSDVPDLIAHQALARRHGATLLVDMAHDLGSMGPDGLGALSAQGLLGQIDVVMGSFSKTFASNGGFVASSAPGLKLAIRYGCGPHTFSNALSPVQASVVMKALELVQSAEGQIRRDHLLRNAVALREVVAQAGCLALGQPSAVVPVLMGSTPRCRLTSRFLLEGGVIGNAVEYPAVARSAARLRLQVMADHSLDDIEAFRAVFGTAVARADAELALLFPSEGQTESA